MNTHEACANGSHSQRKTRKSPHASGPVIRILEFSSWLAEASGKELRSYKTD
jgi:hypothetical protein